MHSVTSRAVQSVHLAADPVIKSFTASTGARVLSGQCQPDGCTQDTDREVKANASDLSLKAKAKTKGLITEAKAKARDLNLKAKAIDQGHAILSSRRLEANEMASRTPTLQFCYVYRYL